MSRLEQMVDIHCHLVPGIDDGARNLGDSLEMARMAVNDGIATIIATPHQLGNFAGNSGQLIRTKVNELSRVFKQQQIPLNVAPGADVRIDVNLANRIRDGEVVSLADRKRHVLLELPHELYFPLEPVLDELQAAGMVGILSHPERNKGLLAQPQLIKPLVEYGCLMQVTGGSLTGAFGTASREMAEWMVQQGLTHFLATDAHGLKSRRPVLQEAYEEACRLIGIQAAQLMCRDNPSSVLLGRDVDPAMPVRKASLLGRLFGKKRAA